MAISFEDAKRRVREFIERPMSSKQGASSLREEAVDLVRTVGVAVAIALALRIVLFQPFNIPSGSMKPTLLVGDFLFVSKFTYGYSPASLVWPFTRIDADGRLFGSTPKRGDIIVFKNPENGKRDEFAAYFQDADASELDRRVAQRPHYNKDYIKRLVGMPGDTIAVRGGVLHVNGAPVEKEYLGDREADCGPTGARATRLTPFYRETLPNGVSYVVRECYGDRGPYDDFPAITVREGHYFFMGDNRDGSEDSRGDVGQVPYENLVGKAQFVFFSADGGKARIWELWKWPFAIRYGRIAQGVR